MELKEFAEIVLFGPTLTEKMHNPENLSDHSPGPLLSARPQAPTRPPELRFSRPGEKKQFPADHALENPKARGTVLHFFANHELLAMELMALAILCFPDAPTKFRLGLAQTILDEQRHLSLYAQRMRDLGVNFGDVSVNSYFWDAVAKTPSPLAFVAQMSLTFEQANLDFSRHYLRLFQNLGDLPSAEIMASVYQDEMQHVRHGAHWLNQWKKPEESDWSAYVAALPPPLTPRRARGDEVDVEARQKAGLSEKFIAELRVFNHSRGRPPVVFSFNPACEDEVASGRASYVAPAMLRTITEDLASLMMFVAQSDDVVMVPKKPSTETLSKLGRSGYNMPQFVVQAKRELQGRFIDRFEPWGQSPAERQRLARVNVRSRQANAPTAPAIVFSKSWSSHLQTQLTPEIATQVCTDLPAVIAAIEHFAEQNSRQVIKAPFAASGRSSLHLMGSRLTASETGWVKRVLEKQGVVIVEPWLCRVADLSVQIMVSTATSESRVVGVTRFLTDARGRYVGHILGRTRGFRAFGPEDQRQIHAQDFAAQLEAKALQVLEALSKEGYAGPAGIDALLYRETNGALKLRPIVEVNPRYTMGRIALGIGKRVHAAADALWLHMSLSRVEKLGFRSLAAYAAELENRFPLQLKQGLIAEGFVPTNDPLAAKTVLTAVVAGECCRHLMDKCEISLLGYPSRFEPQEPE